MRRCSLRSSAASFLEDGKRGLPPADDSTATTDQQVELSCTVARDASKLGDLASLYALDPSHNLHRRPVASTKRRIGVPPGPVVFVPVSVSS